MFRNKDFLRVSLFAFGLAVILITAGFLVSTRTGLLVSITTLVFGSIFFFFTRERYRSISRISSQIDAVLHNEDRFSLDGFDEGELSILHNDITKMTLRIREQNEALVEDKKFLADSLADIAHQLRTPLTSTNLILSLLAKNPSEEDRHDFIREVEDLLAHMDWLITSLLKISRLDAGVTVFQNETVRVDDLVTASTRSLAIPLEIRNIALKVNIPDNAVIMCDMAWLSEAVLNILKNCMDSIGENGSIEISCVSNSLYTELSIHDSGKGFENKDIPHLFDRFYRSSSDNSTGYGIGLALAKMIIVKQNGIISAKNHPDGGAVFILRFSNTTS